MELVKRQLCCEPRAVAAGNVFASPLFKMYCYWEAAVLDDSVLYHLVGELGRPLEVVSVECLGRKETAVDPDDLALVTKFAEQEIKKTDQAKEHACVW